MVRVVNLVFATAFLLVANAQKPIPCPEAGTDCVTVPTECKTGCNFGASLALKDGKLVVNLAQEVGANRYVAVGFSRNREMASTIVVICTPDEKVVLKKNPGAGSSSPVDITFTSGTAPTGTVKKDGNRLDCSFEMSPKFDVGPAPGNSRDSALGFDLTQESAVIVVVNGPWRSNAPGRHGGRGGVKFGRFGAGAEGQIEDRNEPAQNANPRIRATFAVTISAVILALLVFA